MKGTTGSLTGLGAVSFLGGGGDVSFLGGSGAVSFLGGGGDALNPKETPVNRTSGVLSVVKPFSPVTIAVGLGSQVLAPAAIELAKQREKARQARLYQLVPGKTDVSGKPAQIRPLKKT